MKLPRVIFQVLKVASMKMTSPAELRRPVPQKFTDVSEVFTDSIRTITYSPDDGSAKHT
jgi:hypothetical protein